MAKTIRDENGKYAGSVGSGKTTIPTPSTVPAASARVPVRHVDRDTWARLKDTFDKISVRAADDAPSDEVRERAAARLASFGPVTAENLREAIESLALANGQDPGDVDEALSTAFGAQSRYEEKARYHSGDYLGEDEEAEAAAALSDIGFSDTDANTIASEIMAVYPDHRFWDTTLAPYSQQP